MDTRRKKLKFRAWHRGFREMDLLMGPYADAHLETLSATELDQFEQLLEAPDWDVYYWITGQVEAPEQVNGTVLEGLKAFRFTASHRS